MSELLVCLIILIMTASCTSSILSMVVRSQQKTKFEVDRIKFVSVLNASLIDSLTFARDIMCETDNVIFTSDVGKDVKFELMDGTVMIVYRDKSFTPLIPDSSYGNIKLSKFNIVYDDDTDIFSVEYAICEPGGSESVCRKKIMCIS